MERQLKGISVILFGMLLCCGASGLNSAIFAAVGVIFGAAGLVIAFTKGNSK